MPAAVVPQGKPIRLVVWSLDGAPWAEPQNDEVSLQPLARKLVATLDERGILQSAVGRNDRHRAQAQLRHFGLAEYFLCSQLGASDKSLALREIATELDVGFDSVLLIDAEASGAQRTLHACPQLRTLEPAALPHLANDPLMGLSLVGIEPRPRRLIYLEEHARRESERHFLGSKAEFHASLDMQLTVKRAAHRDLRRLQELANRTNQLAVTYSEEELAYLLSSPDHACWLVSLEDRFGDCGAVGLVLLAISADRWTLMLFLFSCRVRSRDIDTIVLNALLRRARAAGVRLRAYFRVTSRNESLWLAYQRGGFRQIDSEGDLLVLEHTLADIPSRPPCVRLCGEWTDA
jgi:FkbH-like protein